MAVRRPDTVAGRRVVLRRTAGALYGTTSTDRRRSDSHGDATHGCPAAAVVDVDVIVVVVLVVVVLGVVVVADVTCGAGELPGGQVKGEGVGAAVAFAPEVDPVETIDVVVPEAAAAEPEGPPLLGVDRGVGAWLGADR